MLSDFRGVVTDPTGAGVPGATVNATNEATKAKRTATSDNTGNYRIDGLLVGTYSLEVEAAGFKKFVQTGILLTPGLVKPVNARLEIGQVTELAEVHDTAPVIQTESGTLSTSLPPTALSKPIVTMSRGAILGEMMVWMPGSASGDKTYGYMGQRPEMMQANIEGLQYYFISSSVNFAGIQDISTILSNAPAEFARPVTLNATLKSGTNQFHGSYIRVFVNPCFNATKSPFSQANHGPCATSFRQFFEFSGPIRKDKTFFYFNWGRPNSFNLVQLAQPGSVPTRAMQAGDFSRYPKTILDPATGTPFPGNIIPPSRIGPLAQGIVKDLYSQLTYLGSQDSFVNNRSTLAARFRQDTDYTAKIDHMQGVRNIFSGTYYRHKVLSNLANLFPIANRPQALPTAGQGNVFNFGGVLAYTHTFSPTVISQLRIGATRFVLKHLQIEPNEISQGKVINGSDYVQRWGIQGLLPPDLAGLPQVNIVGWNFIPNDNQSANFDTRYSAYENVTIVRGNHTLKTGYSAIRLLQDGPAAGPYFGSFNYNGMFTTEAFADFLLGLPDSFIRYRTRPVIARRMWEHGAFLQDDFKVSNRLTINFGLRWDRYTVPYDRNGLYYNFDPKTLSIVVPDQHAAANVNPAWPATPFPIRLASDVGFPSKLLRGSNSWQPRFGFAYRLASNMVLRGGWGIYNSAVRFGSLQTGGPFAITETFINEKASNRTGAVYALPNPFPVESKTASVASANGFSLDYRPAYSQNWNITLERQLFKNWGLKSSYRGVKNSQLLWLQNLNAIAPSTTAFTQSRRPYPNLQTVGFVSNGGNSWYEGFDIGVTHPLASGVFITAQYTRSWSGGLPSAAYTDDQTIATPENAFDLRRDYGPDSGWPTNDFILSWVSELPFGRGKRFANSGNKFLNGVIGNWSLSGAFSWRSGLFFTPVLNGVDVGNIGGTNNRRPSLAAGCDPYAGRRNVHTSWFNPGCFVSPAPGELGNVRVNSLVGPGAWQINFSPFKEFPLGFIREGARIQIGANMVNVLNHPVYNRPISNLTAPTAGLITSTTYARGLNHDAVGPRSVIFEGRIIF